MTCLQNRENNLKLYYLILGLVFFTQLSIGQNKKQPIIDFHVHITYQKVGDRFKVTKDVTKQKISDWYEENHLEPIGIVWLSPTYALWDHQKNYYKVLRDILIDFSDKILVQSDYYGLCGVTLDQEISERRFQFNLLLCGNYKFSGYKLRAVSLNKPVLLQRFEDVLAKAHRANKIVLVHFFPQNVSQETIDNTHVQDPSWSRFLALAKKYSDAKIVIAHSGGNSFIGLDGLKKIGLARRQQGIYKNVFIELSANPWMYVNEQNKHPKRFCKPTNNNIIDLSKAWSNFGTNYILYGSDLTGGDIALDDPDQVYPPESTSIGLVECPYMKLSDAEKQKIYWENAQRLLDSLP